MFLWVTFGLWLSSLTGTQVSTVIQDFCEQHGYDIYPMKQMLHLEGTGGFYIPYLWHTEATLRTPPIRNYDECAGLPLKKQVEASKII